MSYFVEHKRAAIFNVANSSVHITGKIPATILSKKVRNSCCDTHSLEKFLGEVGDRSGVAYWRVKGVRDEMSKWDLLDGAFGGDMETSRLSL